MSKRRRFDKMYKQYADDIFRFLLVHVRENQLAEDLTADTFLKAWQRINTFDGKYTRAWLYTIARNNLTDYWRKKRPETLDEEIEVIDEKPTNDEKLDAKMLSQTINSAIGKLPHDMKSVVALRFMQGYSVRQTAEALSLSEANVRVIQYRALKRLRGVLS